MRFVARSSNTWLTVLFAGTDVLQLGDDGRSQATYDCSITEIYRLERFDSHIIYLNNGFIGILSRLNI